MSAIPEDPPIRLETNRLILRSFKEEDCKPFSLYRSDPEVACYQGWEAPFSLEQAARLFLSMRSRTPGEPGQWYQMALELKTSAEMIGDCAFKRLAENNAQAEIGFTLAPRYQHQGYAAEAVRCLIDFLFGTLHMHRIIANCDPNNIASARLLQKVGLRCEGRFIESLWFKGYWASEDWYAILDREWVHEGK
jgi:RimJ/RimL family protein N-acetyltransferase